MRVLLLTGVLLAAVGAMPAPQDQEPPAVPGLGLASAGRMAHKVTVRFSEKIAPEVGIVSRTGGKPTGAKTGEPVDALSRYSLALARRFFEDAKWGTPRNRGKGRELVITSIKVLSQRGPLYEVQVQVERRENGKRLGQGSGMGMVAPDRHSQRMGAAFAPGLLGAAAAHDANRPKASKDQVAIMQATLQAMERAIMPLASYWAGEQMAADARRRR